MNTSYVNNEYRLKPLQNPNSSLKNKKYRHFRAGGNLARHYINV